MTRPEDAVLAAIEEPKPKWWEPLERANRRGARMTVEAPPFEIRREVTPPAGRFVDAEETNYADETERPAGRRFPSFRHITPPPPRDPIHEWMSTTVHLQRALQLRMYRDPDAILIPDCYPHLVSLFGIPIYQLPIRGGYIGYRYEGTMSGLAHAMSNYQVLNRTSGETWLFADGALVREAARFERRFVVPHRASLADFRRPADPAFETRSFSELTGLQVCEVPADAIYVGYSMILPYIVDVEREIERQRNHDSAAWEVAE